MHFVTTVAPIWSEQKQRGLNLRFGTVTVIELKAICTIFCVLSSWRVVSQCFVASPKYQIDSASRLFFGVRQDKILLQPLCSAY